MTLTAMIGALVALVPRANGDWFDRVERLARRVDQLTRSQAKLIDHIQSLEQALLAERHRTQTITEEAESLNRRLAIQRDLTIHWRDEAMRVASVSRELAQLQPHDGRNALAYAQQMQAQLAQYTQLQNQQLAQPNPMQQGFCNCTPSRAQVWRAQVWAAENSLVSRLNREYPDKARK